MSANATNNYKTLEKKAILWDSMPFDVITFSGRVIKKYGKEYFRERYQYICGSYYKDLEHKKLDTLQKVINLGFENAKLQKNSVEEGYIPMMYVPEEYWEIWKNAIPLKYFRDYKDRKKLLDSYLRTLPLNQQADAIRIMCGNNETRNYLSFLDLNFETANEQQKSLFEDLVSFYEKEFAIREQEKEMLAKKALDSASNSANDLYNIKTKNDFLSNAEIFKQQDYAKINEDNYLAASNLFAKPALQEQSMNNSINNSQIEELNIEPNAFSKVKSSPFDISNKAYDENIINKISLSSLRNKQPSMIALNTNTFNNTPVTSNIKSTQQLNQNFTYNEYIKNANAYNIVDLINNRMAEDTNNKNIVNQIVKSSIYVNDYYSKAVSSNNGKPVLNVNNNLLFNPLTPKLNLLVNKNKDISEPKSNANLVSRASNQFNLNLHVDEDEKLKSIRNSNNSLLVSKQSNFNSLYANNNNKGKSDSQQLAVIAKKQISAPPFKLKIQNFDDENFEETKKIDLKKLVAVPTTRIK